MACRHCGKKHGHTQNCTRQTSLKPRPGRLPNGKKITLELAKEWRRTVGAEWLSEGSQAIIDWLIAEAEK